MHTALIIICNIVSMLSFGVCGYLVNDMVHLKRYGKVHKKTMQIIEETRKESEGLEKAHEALAPGAPESPDTFQISMELIKKQCKIIGRIDVMEEISE